MKEIPFVHKSGALWLGLDVGQAVWTVVYMVDVTRAGYNIGE